MSMGFLFERNKIFQNEIIVRVAQPCEYTKNMYTLNE